MGAASSPMGRWPRGLDAVATTVVLAGFAALVLPLFWNLAVGRLTDGFQGHEPAIFAVSAFLLYRARERLVALPEPPSAWPGGALFIAGLALYVAGRALDLRFALLAVVVLAAAVLAIYRGFAALRQVWFALLFPVFALPLPLEMVLALTGPLKLGVSAVATTILQAADYPIGRSGAVITIGQYRLLVTEACAGLQTMFTLEAMGLLYASLMNHASPLRNALLALLVMPIAFAANVVRVIVLALITYHFGNDAGQGFLHGFSGIVLFLVALVLVVSVDGLLGRIPGLAPRRS